MVFGLMLLAVALHKEHVLNVHNVNKAFAASAVHLRIIINVGVVKLLLMSDFGLSGILTGNSSTNR